MEKNERFSVKTLSESLKNISGLEKFRAVLLFDKGVPVDDLFTLVWLAGGNLEPERDITMIVTQTGSKTVLADATFKTGRNDGFTRDWPNVVTMDQETIHVVDKKWPDLGLGGFIKSPSLKYHPLVSGNGAVREGS